MEILGSKYFNLSLHNVAFREHLIPPDVHLFMTAECLGLLVVSEELAQAMVEKVQGIALIRTRTV